MSETVSLHVNVITPDKYLFEDKAVDLRIPCHDGEVGILAMHENAAFKLKNGVLYIKDEQSCEISLYIDGGLAEVFGKRCCIFTSFGFSMDQDIAYLRKQLDNMNIDDSSSDKQKLRAFCLEEAIRIKEKK